MKRILAALLSATMIFGLAACGGSETESEGTAESTETPTYKIGILTGTVSQGEEEFRAAEKMKEKYGDMIITKTYPDNFMKETDYEKNSSSTFKCNNDFRIGSMWRL